VNTAGPGLIWESETMPCELQEVMKKMMMGKVAILMVMVLTDGDDGTAVVMVLTVLMVMVMVGW
jgi:hypothetical protein